MADATLGVAVLRTRLDASGLKTGLNQARSETQAATRGMSTNIQQLTTGLVAAGGALYAARGLISGARTYAGEAERAANATLIFNKQVARSQVDSREAAAMVDRLASRFGVLPQTVQESVTLLLRAGGTLEDAERLLTAAGASAAAVGFDIGTAFDNAATAVATGRSELLETSGIVANLGPVTQAYAKAHGKVVDQLTEEEVVRARVNAIYEESKAEIEDVDQLLSGLVGTESRVRTETAELRQEFGQRFLPIVKAVGDGIAGAVGWFNDLPQPIKTAATGLVAFGAAGATLVTTAAGLKVALVALGPAFAGVRAAMLPFLGPAGVLALLAVGLYAVWTAMDVGRRSREEMSRQFDTLIGKMQTYRQQLVITSEAEREAAIQSLERQRVALGNILNVTRSRLQQELAFVREYEQKSFLGQIVSGDSLAADAAMRSARELERQVAELERQVAAVDQQLAQARTLTITPVVEPPPPGSFDIPEDGEVRNVEVVVTVRSATTAEELFDALLGEGTAVTRAVARLGGRPEQVLEGLQRRAELFEAAMQRAWEIPDLTADQFDYLVRRGAELAESAEAFEHAMSMSRMTGPDGTRGPLPDIEGPVTSLYQRVLQRGMARFRETDRALLAAADEPPPPTLNERVRARARRSFAEIDRALLAELEASRRPLDPGASLGLTTVIPRQAGGIADAWAEHLEDETQRLAERLDSMDITTTNTDLAIRRERELAMERERLAKIGEDARRAEELRWRDIVAAQRWGGDAARRYTEQVNLQTATIRLAAREGITLTEALQRLTGTLRTTAEQAEFNARVGQLSLQLAARANRGDGGLGEAKNILERQERATADGIAAQLAAADTFAQTVVNAGIGFADAAIRAIQEGDIPGLIQAGLSGAGSILGQMDLGTATLGLGGSILGSIPLGGLIAGGLGLLGTLLGALAGGGRSDADRAAAEARRVGNVPAIELHFTVNQTNHYQGGPNQPENEQAFRRQANVLFEELYRRHLGPRLDRIEQRLGIAGAPA